MLEKVQLGKKTYLSSLSSLEKIEIEEKVQFEFEYTNFKTFAKMTKIGGLANVLGGLFVVWVLYHQVDQILLLSWYAILFTLNMTNIVWSAYFDYRYKDMTRILLRNWLRGLYVIMACMCLTWGAIGFLFVPRDPYYELYIITFLQVVALSYGFGATFDFDLALDSVICLLLPTIIFRIYEAIIYETYLKGSEFVVDVGFSISLLILGIFLLVVCYIGYVLTKNQSLLSSLNSTLNEKLEDINKFLEERVKERTVELEKSLKLVTYQATHDLLTDLPNQRLLTEVLQTSIVKAKQKEQLFAIACFCLNELDKINDGLGHQVGDFVIKTIAKRLEVAHEKFKVILNNYVVALSRRDVFVILIDPIDIATVEEEVKQLLNVVEESIYTENQVVKLTASIGLSIYPLNGNDSKTLLMNAEAAMLRARQFGGNRIDMYKAEINADISKQLALENHLYQAMKNNEFILRYQLFVDLKTGEICGAEALVRLNSSTFGMVSPAVFIPLAEANGLILPLGEWVLKTGCEQLKQWQAAGHEKFKLAINLSAKQLHQKNIVQVITTILQKAQIDPHNIELELTETAVFQEDVFPIIKQLKALGVSLSIDDFGTGYSGLSNLKRFDIDKLKIDKSFVQDIDKSQDSRAIVANTIAMAKKMNILVLAEGVETREQLNILLELGCDMVQGFYFSQPVSAEIFTELLQSRKKFEI